MTIDRERIGVQQAAIGQGFHQAAHAARIIKIFHQIGVTTRANIRQHRHFAAEGIEIIECERNAGAARDGYQMDDRVGRAALGHRYCERIFKVFTAEQTRGREIFPHHIDNAAAALRGHALVIGIHRRDARSPRQRHAQRLGNAHHRGGRAHHHASAGAAGNATFNLHPLRLADVASAAFIPILEGVRP